MLDGGKARHCGRDEYVAYMRRVAEHGPMRVHEHAKVVDIKRNTSTGRFSVHANHRSEQSEMLQLQHGADAVVLAFGAASLPKPFRLDPGTVDGARVSRLTSRQPANTPAVTYSSLAPDLPVWSRL